MIDVVEAKKIIEENTKLLQPIKLTLLEAAGKILAEDIYTITDIPAFPQSAMDGYAFNFENWKQQPLIIEGEVAAGSNDMFTLSSGRTVRIFTGAPVPQGADTVVMQEKVALQNNKLVIEDEQIQKGLNVRPKGSEIKAGDIALAKGDLLTPAAVAFLAGIGIKEVMAIPNPAISIIITGKELREPGNTLEYGQVYESNSFSLTTALKQLHLNNIKIFRADDELAALTGILQEALKESDIVLLTGGISAGDYDFVLQAAENCDVMKLFHKIKQRPGKPLYFGKKNDRLVFGLPGNPSSVLTCFYEYVLPALELLTGQTLSLKTQQAPLSDSFKKKAMLTHFLKGYYNGKEVIILDAQESYRMSSFAKANCFVVIKEEVMECRAGEIMEVHLLPV